MSQVGQVKTHADVLIISTIVATISVAVVALGIISQLQVSFENFALSKSITMYALGGVGLLAGIIVGYLNKGRISEIASENDAMRVNMNKNTPFSSPAKVEGGGRNSMISPGATIVEATMSSPPPGAIPRTP